MAFCTARGTGLEENVHPWEKSLGMTQEVSKKIIIIKIKMRSPKSRFLLGDGNPTRYQHA